MQWVNVKFRRFKKWTRSYTYKTSLPLSRNDIVIVPVDDFYDVGKVYEVMEDFNPNPNIKYKAIVARINGVIEKFEEYND